MLHINHFTGCILVQNLPFELLQLRRVYNELSLWLLASGLQLFFAPACLVDCLRNTLWASTLWSLLSWLHGVIPWRRSFKVSEALVDNNWVIIRCKFLSSFAWNDLPLSSWSIHSLIHWVIFHSSTRHQQLRRTIHVTRSWTHNFLDLPNCPACNLCCMITTLLRSASHLSVAMQSWWLRSTTCRSQTFAWRSWMQSLVRRRTVQCLMMVLRCKVEDLYSLGLFLLSSRFVLLSWGWCGAPLASTNTASHYDHIWLATLVSLLIW